jgi:uncharacterized DUF497 family protein
LPAISAQVSGGTLCQTPLQKPGWLQDAAPLNNSSAGPPFTAANASFPTPLVKWVLRIYIYAVRITYDSPKRDWTLTNRGLDFEDAASVFDGLTAEVEDSRKDYGETRIICFGMLQNRLVVVGYTPRGAVRHVFSMRKANEREQARFAPYFGL